MEGSGSDEQNMFGMHHSVARADGCSFHNRENIALNAFPAHVGAVSGFASRNLIEFVDENDTGLFDAIDGFSGNLVQINQASFLFTDQVVHGLNDLHLPHNRTGCEDSRQKVLERQIELLLAWKREHLERRVKAFRDLYLDNLIIELTLAKLLPKSVALSTCCRRYRLTVFLGQGFF